MSDNLAHAHQPSDDRVQRLTELAELRQTGVLTDAEFEVEKAKLLSPEAPPLQVVPVADAGPPAPGVPAGAEGSNWDWKDFVLTVALVITSCWIGGLAYRFTRANDETHFGVHSRGRSRMRSLAWASAISAPVWVVIVVGILTGGGGS